MEQTDEFTRQPNYETISPENLRSHQRRIASRLWQVVNTEQVNPPGINTSGTVANVQQGNGTGQEYLSIKDRL